MDSVTKFNWVEEVRSMIKKKIESYKILRPKLLRYVGYIDMLCHISCAFDTIPTTPQSIAPLLSRPIDFVKEEPISQVYSPFPNPKPPLILEDIIKVHGDNLAKGKPNAFFLLLREDPSPSMSITYSLVVEQA